jgi:tRNA-specific 2-thiouridylase
MPEYLAQALQQDNEDDSSIMSNLLFHSKNPVLLAARDLSKDQSYFLTGVSGEALRNVLFPLGDYLKSKKNGDDNDDKTVREVALEAQLPTAHKRDSMGICFVGKRKHGSFVDEFIEKAPTNQPPLQCINVETGEAVATFDEPNLSLVYATIGQGAKLSGAAQKWFVVDKPHPRTVVICSGTHHPALYADRLYVQDMNWIVGPPPKLPFRAQCRIRHLQPLVDCEIRPHQDSNSSNHGYEIVLDSPLRGIAPGQVCGIYYNDVVCLGGGAIVQRGPTYWELQKDLPKALHPSGHNDLSSSQQQQLGRRGQ